MDTSRETSSPPPDARPVPPRAPRVPRPRSPGGLAARLGPGLLAAVLVAGTAAGGGLAPAAAGTADAPATATATPTPTPTPTPTGVSCTSLGTSREGRAWLPRARLVVAGGAVRDARALSPSTRVTLVDGLVEVQRTARRTADGRPVAGPVVLELRLAPDAGAPGRGSPGTGTAGTAGAATCTVDLLAPAGAHGVRRLVRAH